MKKKINRVVTQICRFLAIVSIILISVFFVNLINLNLLPKIYLAVIGLSITIVYLFLLIFIWPKSIKSFIKVIFTTLLMAISIFLFLFSESYIDKTIGFFNKINALVTQKENYYVFVLEDNNFSNIDDLINKNIGYYNVSNTSNIEKALIFLEEKLTFNGKVYTDIELMISDLKSGIIDAILINESLKNIYETELLCLEINMRSIDNFDVEVETKDIVKYADVTMSPFHIYIAGSDAFGSIEQVTNTDVNMVVTVIPNENKMLLTSIPRDYYVELPGTGGKDKLTHAGYYGIETSVKAVEKLLDIEINYYVKVNFSTVEDIVNIIGGIEIYNQKYFCANGSSYLCYDAGNIQLDGFEALMYSRERYAFADGDVQRIKNQQKVLIAIIKKLTSSTKFISEYVRIIDSLENTFSTNMDEESISNFVKKQINDMKGWEIENQNLVGYDYYTYGTYTFPNLNLYVMNQNVDSVNCVRDKIKSFINGYK